MYIATLPFFPADKRNYDMDEISAKQRVMMDLYPEIYSCIGCNACTKGLSPVLKCHAVYRLRPAR